MISIKFRRIFAWIAWGCLAWCIVIFTPLSYVYSLPLREEVHPKKADVIVLLSSGQLGRWLSLDGAQRTWGALDLYKRGYAPRIISSGSTKAKGNDQAAVQAGLLILAGVPEDAIIVESASSRTYESVAEVTAIMRHSGWSSAVVVTSQLDVPRLRRLFAREGLSVSYQAVPEFGPPTGLIYMPGGFMTFYHASYEYAGLFLYKMRGWI